jgi:hypothetical protein
VQTRQGESDMTQEECGVTAVTPSREALTHLPICAPCVRGEGSECHTPGCALFLRDVPADGLIAEFALDLASLIPDGDESRYSNPEGAQESIIYDCLTAYVARAEQAAADRARIEAVLALADAWDDPDPERGDPDKADALRAALDSEGGVT